MCEGHLKNGRLRSANHGRQTRQRTAIRAAADSMRGTFSADDLLAAVRAKSPRTGRATVYRALAGMVAAGFVEQVGSLGGAALYARCRTGEHHHHLVCTGCGRVEETECQLDEMVGRARTTSGFIVTRHELNLFGLCSDCA